MPRIPRGAVSGLVLHILNRGNGRSRVFHSATDYLACIRLLGEAKTRTPIDLYAFVLMPNHFHLVARPRHAEALSQFMQWWMTSHVRRHHTIYKSSGHVWQGRFKSFPVQEDNHLLTVLRYVLLNPVRPGLARTPREWPWSSLVFPGLTDPWPVSAPTDWGSWLGDYPSDTEFKELRKSLVRRAPYGDPSWQQTVAKQAGLEATLRPIGRPHNEIAISMPAAGK